MPQITSIWLRGQHLIQAKYKSTSERGVISLCVGTLLPVDPPKGTSNVQSVSISWRYHVETVCIYIYILLRKDETIVTIELTNGRSINFGE